MTTGQPAEVHSTVAAGEALAARTRGHVTRRLIPYLVFIYLLAYLDRANLSVAKLQMQQELGFTDAVIGLGAGIFFLGYLLLDIPGSLIVERWSARKWMARIMISWGICATLMGLLGTRMFGSLGLTTQFYGMRLLLGISEAGFFPGVIVYLTHWFRAEDRPRAKAFFMVTQPISIALGVPISRMILENVAWAGLAGWRWVFILEGILPIPMGLITLWYLTDRPQNARWLPDDEKRWLTGALAAEEARKSSGKRMSALDALRYPQTYLLIAVYFLVVVGNQALIFFLPSITETMKSLPLAFRTAAAGAPYACSAVGILLNGILAERTGELRWHTAAPMLVTGTLLAAVGLAGGHAWLTVAILCAAGFTSQAYLPAFWTLPGTLLGKSAAATATGLVCLGSVGGFVGPWLFGYLKTLTGRYDTGIYVLAGCMLLAGTLATQVRVVRVRHGVE
jgi:ACS family tartrate transporter-like MFS transporter